MKKEAGLKLEVEYSAKAYPQEGMSMDELKAILEGAGNQIIETHADHYVIGYEKSEAMRIING